MTSVEQAGASEPSAVRCEISQTAYMLTTATCGKSNFMTQSKVVAQRKCTCRPNVYLPYTYHLCVYTPRFHMHTAWARFHMHTASEPSAVRCEISQTAYMLTTATCGKSMFRNVRQFRGGLVFKADRHVYHSTPGSKVVMKEKELIFR